MCPITHTSFLALGTSVIASFIFGFLWYGPIFGKTWAGLMGFAFDPEKCKGAPPASSLLLTLLGTAFTTFTMAYILNTCNPPCGHIRIALLVWLGFYVPFFFGQVSWEKRPWKLFVLNAVYYMLSLQLISFILTHLK
jgi:hypothetical protein